MAITVQYPIPKIHPTFRKLNSFRAKDKTLWKERREGSKSFVIARACPRFKHLGWVVVEVVVVVNSYRNCGKSLGFCCCSSLDSSSLSSESLCLMNFSGLNTMSKRVGSSSFSAKSPSGSKMISKRLGTRSASFFVLLQQQKSFNF